MKTTVSEKGQITIPKKLRQSLGLKAGIVLEIVEDNGCFVARKRVEEDKFEKWRGAGKLPFGENGNEYLKIIRGE